MRSKLRGWWRYSDLRAGTVTVVVTALLVAITAALATGGGLVWAAAAVVTVVLLIVFGRGAWRAERARRFGCW